MSELTGYLFDNTGAAIPSATVQLLTKNTSTQVASTSTNSDGKWSFSGQPAAAYDVKLTFGSSVRFIKGDQEVQATMGEFISSESNSTYPLRVENATNNASNAVLELRGNNSTRADGDEIYVSFKLNDDGGNSTEFARITAEANDVSNGSEDGELRYSVMSGGSLTEVFVMSSAIGGGTAFDITTSTVSMATDSFTIKSEDDGSPAVLKLQADQGDDNADKWQVSVADGGTLTINSEISGSAVAHMTLTPNSTVTSSTVAFAGLVTTAGNLTVGGDLTITGDDLFMGTNTAGMLLIADGTNFNPTSITSLSAISSIGAADTLLAIDDTDGALKKVTRSTLVSGLASGTMTDVVDDTSPELGGDLDVLERAIVTGASNRNIALTPHGTGVVRIDGTNGVDIESGAISIKNGGAESYVRFYCESSNAHYTQLQASPHSAYSGNVTVVLPAAATNLVGDDTTQTLTNKRLTSPKINEDVTLTATATELNLLDNVSGLVKADFTKLAAVDATATELNIMDGNTTVGTDAIADDDGIVTNDGGTMKQTKVQTLATYMEGEIDNLTALTQAVFVGKDASITDDTATGMVATMTALTGVSVGELVHIDGNGKIDQAHADASADMPAIGIALEANSSGSDADIKVLLQGFYKDVDQFDFSSNIGEAVFADHSGEGNFTQSPSTTDGHFIQKVGIALSADTLYFSPSLDVIERD
ncbi:MAG: hypothetical protein Unbinned1068contig1000_25 [Prokaryotic dsDNA virus sp.]|nr:MAG: hypothetical protein Unbinned1068contig1000_25 [Prokaryotic dsDNA virus sp.]|tara:strand:- start:1871 stop:3985 length:2115 start_codon:yes stop_codon:yes gene_type:complete